MRFGSIAQFLEFLATRPAAVDAAEARGQDAAGRLLVEEAKHLIGRESEEWEPLAPSTIEEKDRLGYTGRISDTDPLYRTGELRISIASDVTHGNPGTVVLGSDDPIAPHQEFGTDRIPPRSFIGSTMHVHGPEAAKLIGNHVMGAVAGLSGPLVPVPRRDGDNDR